MPAWLRDRLLHALLRCLAGRPGQRPARRWGGLLALLLGVVLVIGALHWAHKLQALPGLPGALRPWAAAASRWAVAQGGLPVRAALTVELLRLPACLLPLPLAACWLPLPGCVRSAEGLPLSGLPLMLYIAWLVPMLEQFPRSQRFLLGVRLQGLALDFLAAQRLRCAWLRLTI